MIVIYVLVIYREHRGLNDCKIDHKLDIRDDKNCRADESQKIESHISHALSSQCNSCEISDVFWVKANHSYNSCDSVAKFAIL